MTGMWTASPCFKDEYVITQCTHLQSFLLQIKTMAKELDIAFLTVGFDPKWAVADVPIMPKNRYKYAVPALLTFLFSMAPPHTGMHEVALRQNMQLYLYA